MRMALRERDVLAARAAPGQAIPFVLASTRNPLQRAKCVAGLPAYTTLDGFRRPLPRPVGGREAGQLVPPLLTENVGLRAVFHEARANDARLTLATVTAANRPGPFSPITCGSWGWTWRLARSPECS